MSDENNGNVTVGTVQKQEQYVLNGDLVTVADAVDKFFRGDGLPNGMTAKLNGRPVRSNDHELRDGDCLLFLSSTVASAGIKGA